MMKVHTTVSAGPEDAFALVLHDVSFRLAGRMFGPSSMRVRKGEIVGLLGPNGAGKTSFVRIIEGGVKPLAGTLRLFDTDITALNRLQRRNAGVLVCLHERRRLRVNRSILEIVAAAINRSPEALVLDEPFDGLQDGIPKNSMKAILKACRDAGIAVLFTDHDIRSALKIVDRAYLLHRGRIVGEGSPEELSGQTGG